MLVETAIFCAIDLHFERQCAAVLSISNSQCISQALGEMHSFYCSLQLIM